MRACVVLDVGVVIDCVILRRVEAEDEFVQSSAPQHKLMNMNRVTSTWIGGGCSAKGSSVKIDTTKVTSILSATQSPEQSVILSPSMSSPRGFAPSPSSSSLPAAQRGGDQDVKYVVRTSLHPHRDVIVDMMDIVPFGFHTPSLVFAVRGRQLTKGMTAMVLDDGSVLVERYPMAKIAHHSEESALGFLMPLPPSNLLSTLGLRQEKTRQARAESEGGGVAALVSAIAATKSNRNILTCTMSEVQLLPMLSAKNPTPPLRVGTAVKVRRRGEPKRLYHGVVTKASYDCSYSVRYEDHTDERAVLHNDVLVVNTSSAEDVGVRDQVTFVVMRNEVPVYGEGVVTMAVGDATYLVYGKLTAAPETHRTSLDEEDDEEEVDEDAHVHESPKNKKSTEDANDSQAFLMKRSNIRTVAPLYLDALRSEHAEVLLPIFRMLDTEQIGTVRWASIVRFFSQSEYAGQPLTLVEWSRMHYDLLAHRGAVPAAEPHCGGLGPADATILDTAITYNEFEAVALRIMKMRW